jgi:hypothetical protein
VHKSEFCVFARYRADARFQPALQRSESHLLVLSLCSRSQNRSTWTCAVEDLVGSCERNRGLDWEFIWEIPSVVQPVTTNPDDSPPTRVHSVLISFH